MKILYRLYTCFTLLLSTALWAQDYNIEKTAFHPFHINGIFSGMSNLWGLADENGREYVIAGLNLGTAIVDVTDPYNPQEIYVVPGANSLWREPKSYGQYAYMVDDEAGEGLLILDLTKAPDTISHVFWTNLPNGETLTQCHTLFIDEAGGFAYLFGCSQMTDGAIILDLKQDPMNPTVVGVHDYKYIHDGFVRNDTLWAAQINNGTVAVFDVSDKNNSQLLAEFATSSNFSHNCWLSDNGKYLFTTDEVSGAFIDAYDVSDLNDIKRIDQIQTSPGSGVIPHNTYVVNTDFLVTSYYRDGVTIHDATYPDNLVEVGKFDTSPQWEGDGFNGAWGVYAYFPSGTIVASDMELGLYVLKPTYKKAANLIVQVKDAFNNAPLFGATVDIAEESMNKITDVFGKAKFGFLQDDTLIVSISKDSYETVLAEAIVKIGEQNILEITLEAPGAFYGKLKVVDENFEPVEEAQVYISNGNREQSSTSNTNGEAMFYFTEMQEWSVWAGKWGYNTHSEAITFEESTTSFPVIQLTKGYYDDFLFDYGWSISGDATSGRWERETPVGTQSNTNNYFNPNVDADDDFGTVCYTTGNGADVVSADDLDNGFTLLTSPIFDLSTYNDPHLSFKTWFANGGGQGTQPNDSLQIRLSNGSETKTLYIAHSNTAQSVWVAHQVRIKDFLTPTATMHIEAYAADSDPGHLVEAAFDRFAVADSGAISGLLPDLDLNIQISPTISSDKVYVNIQTPQHSPFSADEMYIQLTNMEGKIMAVLPLQTTQTIIYTAAYPVGVYHVQIKNKQGKNLYNTLIMKQ